MTEQQFWIELKRLLNADNKPAAGVLILQQLHQWRYELEQQMREADQSRMIH